MLSNYNAIISLLVIITTIIVSNAQPCVYNTNKLTTNTRLCSANKVFVLGVCKITFGQNNDLIRYVPCVYNRFTVRTSWRMGNYRGGPITFNVFDSPLTTNGVTKTNVRASDFGIATRIMLLREGIVSDVWYKPGVQNYRISPRGILQYYENAVFKDVNDICITDCTPVSAYVKKPEDVFVSYKLIGQYQPTVCTESSTDKRVLEAVSNSGPQELKFIKSFTLTKVKMRSVESTKTFSKESQISVNWEVGAELEASAGVSGFAEVSAKATAKVGGDEVNTVSTTFSSGVSTSETEETQIQNNYEIIIPSNSLLIIKRNKIRIDCIKGFNGTIEMRYPDYENTPVETMDEDYTANLRNTEIVDALSYDVSVYVE